jgi:alkaline phosphatase D
MFSRLSQAGRAALLPDSWDGYQAERDRTLDFFQSERLTNVAILAGDMHSSWAFDVPKNPWAGYRSGTGEGSLAVELVTPAVSSPGFFTPATAAGYTSALRAGLPHLKFLDGLERGYLTVDVTPQRLRADWYFAQTVEERSTRERLAASFVCEAGSSRLATA